MRRARPTRRAHLLAAGLAVVGLAGCATPAEPLLAEPVAVPERVKAFPESVVGTAGAAGELTRVLGLLRANCLRDQGFDQAVRALSLRRLANADFARQVLEVLPIEFGPATADQARRYGMAGTELLADSGDIGAVISHSTDFDRASERCESLLRERVAGLANLQERAAGFSDEVHGAFIGQLASRLHDTMLERAACMRADGYPSFTDDAYLGSESMLDLLDSQGVERGVVGDHGGRLPQRQEVPEGQVVVVAPPEARTYAPRAAEVSLAAVFARCGDRVSFAEALERESSKAAALVEAGYRATSSALRAELLDALALLTAPLTEDAAH